jgi:post-segregation antitoxin (ccd killing protein)
MRMARVNISIPDELYDRARRAGLNVSRLAAGALEDELARRAKARALAAYLAELDESLGPVPAAQAGAAREWLAQLDAPTKPRR